MLQMHPALNKKTYNIKTPLHLRLELVTLGTAIKCSTSATTATAKAN